jgi:hypothetical protein
MDTIQVAITNGSYASDLRDLLIRNGARNVINVANPDPDREGILVLDPEHLGLLAGPLKHPERIVLIAHNDPASLSRAWDAGVNSVIFENDPLDTAVLAIMSARLRSLKGRWPAGQSRV